MKFILKILILLIPIKRINKKFTVALVKIDNIGDYILFRNFLPFIRHSQKYSSTNIVLIGNYAWKELAEYFDTDYVDSFFWIYPTQYAKNKWYRLKTLWQIKRLNINNLINTVHSRNWVIDEIVAFNNAQKKITCEGDDVNLTPEIKKKSDAFFQTIIPSLPSSVFEFERNRFFIEKLIDEKIKLERAFFSLNKVGKIENSISIFIGAQSPLRQWSPIKFAHLILAIHKDYPNYFYQILGGKNDKKNSNDIMNFINKAPNSIVINNLCGQTTLVDLVSCIQKTRLLISNETSAIHIAAAVDTQSICIANGERFMRFSPYPQSMTNKIITIFPDDSFYEISNKNIYAEKFCYQSSIDIDTITVDRVLQFIKTIL